MHSFGGFRVITVAALIPAAGKGERLGLGPKAYLPLGEKSLLKHVTEAFEAHVDEVIVAVSQDMLQDVAKHLSQESKVIVGGSSRQETVFKLLEACSCDYVLIHDAARPFISAELIQTCIKTLSKLDALSVAKAVVDTLITKDEGSVVDRSKLLAVQTPQGFKKDLIMRAHRHAVVNNLAATDDAGLVRLLGYEVSIVEGNTWLMKLTTKEDYEMAKLLEANWHET